MSERPWNEHDGVSQPVGLSDDTIVEYESTEGLVCIDRAGECCWENYALVLNSIGRDEIVRWRVYEGELPEGFPMPEPKPGFAILTVETNDGELEMVGQHGEHLYRLVGLKLDGGHADKGTGTIRFTYEDAIPMMGREIAEFKERLETR